MGRVRIRKAFTLVELMIVVSILGILGAIVLPAFGDHIQKAKEAAAKDNLRILRETIGRYAIDHNDVPPGYTENDPTKMAFGIAFKLQLESGYLSGIPGNPFNDLENITIVTNGANFPATADGTTGWIYKPETKEIRVNYAGTDSEGVSYLTY